MQGQETPIRFSSLSEAIRGAYKNGEEDERLEPIVVVDENGSPLGRFKDRDHVIFYDIRGEREIELTESFVDEDFKSFQVEKDLRLNFVTMIEYDKNLKVKVAFPPSEKIGDTLCHVLSKLKMRYIKIVESEKEFHLTYFFNGKSSESLRGEGRLIIPSVKVATPDQMPKMRIKEVTEAIKDSLEVESTQVIIANLANVDVVGHTENEKAIIKTVEVVDSSLGEILKKAEKKKITTIVTADHGTVESWLYPDGTIDTGHTKSHVPFIFVEPDDEILKKIRLKDDGELGDVAPTVLGILALKKPEVMTGKTLLISNPYEQEPRKRLLLLILDGWGASDETVGNLIYKASTPTMDRLIKHFPVTELKASGEAVGMPKGSVGNSEVGHLHLGAGRRIPSDRLRIDNAIADGSFFENPKFIEAMEDARSKGRNLHLLGIVSFYSSHGSLEHLKALLRLAEMLDVKKVYIHAILGRRGEKPESGAKYVKEIEELTKRLNTGKVVTVIGRHWVLDREENWDRVEKAYRTLVFGQGKRVIIG